MKVSGSVRTGFEASPAADAKVAIDHNHSIFPFVGCAFYRTGQDAGGILAVVTEFWEKMPFGHGVSTRIGKIHFGPKMACWNCILHLATHLTRGAANTSPKVHQ
jgi:hypothetical protein